MAEIVFKRNIASLVGGIAIAIGVFILWLLCAGGTGPVEVITGLLAAAAVGVYVRLADL
jgi:multisubunit Na+/H+ antiporter MnhE subunit